MTEAERITQSVNGRPHLAYFDEGISFVWSGSFLEPIEVCPGGYGEPVQHRHYLGLEVAASLQTAMSVSVVETVRAFGDICAAWLGRRCGMCGQIADADDLQREDHDNHCGDCVADCNICARQRAADRR